jgi:hypothetical protein
MSVDLINIQGAINVYELKMTIGDPTISALTSYRIVSIPYTGIASPLDSNVSITAAQYSTDSGTTWETMTPAAGTVTTGLSFTVLGTELTYDWQARTDLGSDMYNNAIRIRFMASGTLGYSLYATKTVLFERTVQTPTSTTESIVLFPDDYSGVFGDSLLVNAPKTN